MSRALVVTGDPTAAILGLLPAIIARVPDLAGFTVGATIPPGVTPERFIRVDSVGELEYEATGLTEADLRVQVWAAGDEFRQSVARQLMAHLRASARAQTVSGPVNLPDPVNSTTLLTQFTVSLLVKGTQA